MSNITNTLKKWGQNFSPEMVQGTQALYSTLVSSPDESQVSRNIPYGKDERHKLDIFSADTKTSAPVLLFVHGGGFVMGDKGNQADAFYNNVGAWALNNGFIGVTMTYRLAPANQWPAGRDDIIAAVKWLIENISEHGGNPAKIFIAGQSAGATHVADVVAAPGEVAPYLAGAMMISGIYDIERAETNDFKKAYFGSNQADYKNASSLSGLLSTKIPCLYSISELDPDDFQDQASRLTSAYVELNNKWPEMHWLKNHNHLSSILQLSSKEDSLGPIILEFMKNKST